MENLQVKLYESYEKKVELNLQNTKKVMLVKKGFEKISSDNVVIEYKKDGKKIASIKLNFMVNSLENIHNLYGVEIVGGYSHKKYMNELAFEINNFILNELEIEMYNYSDLLARGAGSYIIGMDLWGENKRVLYLDIIKDVVFSGSLNILEDYKEEKIFIYNNELYKYKRDLSTLSDYMLKGSYLSGNSAIIINGEDYYYKVGSLN